MPTYEYKCLDCGIQFDRFQSITEDPIQECPECSGQTKRLIGAGAGLIFKGSGFYITDYRSEGYKESAKKDKESSSSGDGDSKGGDSKGGDSKGGDSKSSDSKPSKTESSNASKSTSDTSN